MRGTTTTQRGPVETGCAHGHRRPRCRRHSRREWDDSRGPVTTDNDGLDAAGTLTASGPTPGGRSPTTPFGYAGEYTDPTTGLIYLRARWYDPATGQFLTRDPLLATTMEPYRYAGNDPINFGDPTGLSRCGQFSLGGLIDCGARAGGWAAEHPGDVLTGAGVGVCIATGTVGVCVAMAGVGFFWTQLPTPCGRLHPLV